ncbi:hypothetical protein [Ruminococcus sp. FC2018]|uniref:hypothetical protein n=1 Tax=Ruminococcus sp. FC2018 TaxID=1410617 RepID=UPI00048C2D2B|nr:hypothetical protein [Ruminococcus sp. FC2018]
MKDSYDPLDWNNGQKTQGYDQYSQSDYDNFANNPTYRSNSADDTAAYQDSGYYQDDYSAYNTAQSYGTDNNTYYDSAQMGDAYQSYDGYQQGYDNTYQQPQNNYYSSPAQGAPRYTQADYDYMAQNPTNLREDPNRMAPDQFFSMVQEQDRRKNRQEQIAMFALTSKTRHLYRACGEGSGEISKDFLLYLVALGLGAGIAGLFHASFYLFPLIASLIALIVFVVKSLVIDNTSPIEAMKADALPIVGFVLGIIFTIVLYNKR